MNEKLRFRDVFPNESWLFLQKRKLKKVSDDELQKIHDHMESLANVVRGRPRFKRPWMLPMDHTDDYDSFWGFNNVYDWKLYRLWKWMTKQLQKRREAAKNEKNREKIARMNDEFYCIEVDDADPNAQQITHRRQS